VQNQTMRPPPVLPMPKRNIIAAIVLILAGLGYGYMTAHLPVRTLPNTPDPSFFPWINTTLLLTLSIALLIQGLVQAKPRGSAAVGGGAGRVWAALSLYFVYLLLLPPLGFVLASAPFFAALMALYGERRPAWLVTGGIGVTVLLFVLFRYVFGVLLPRGLLESIVP